MKKIVSETIDGSIKNIIQLKTLDSSLEFSQMFDALQDCPPEFQAKLVESLNSLAQTMGVPATETFNKVLCKSDEDEEVKKKLYNWWRSVFEILSKCKIPQERMDEFNEKVDDLMAEIMKAGDGAATDEELVAEEYEQATKDDEDVMLADMKFAIGKIGEIANKVQDLINFVNPYCGTEVNESMDENEVREFVKAMGFRPDPDGNDYETQLVDALTGKNTDYNAGWGAVYYNSDKVLQFLKKFGMLGSKGIKQREAIAKLKRLFKSGKWKTEQSEFEFTEEEDNSKMTNKKKNMGDDSEWVSMDDIVGMRIGEEEEVNWDDENSYNDGLFEKGMWVIWTDPDGGEESVWKILEMPENPDDFDAVYTLGQKDGSEVEVYGHEIRPRDSDPIEDDEERFDEDGGASNQLNEENTKMKNELKKGDDGWKAVGQPVGEATVTVDANDVWAVLELLDDETAKKNLTDLINSHVRTEEEIMDAIDTCYPENIRKGELNAYMNDSFDEIVSELGLDVERFKETGEFVDSDKPTSVELESGKGGATKKVSLYVDWDDDGAGINRNVVIDVPAEIADSEESDALYDYIMDWIDHQDFCVNDWTITDIEGLDKDVTLEGTDWKDLTEKLDANELVDSIDGWEDRSKKLVVCDAFASGSDIVNVDVLTVTNKRDEVMKMVNEYLLGNVENWQVADASEPRKDENGQFYTELLLKPVYKEVSENNDEVKADDVKDGDKQVTQGGDTKTLVAGEEKKPVCEMTIEQEVTDPWKLLNLLWGQGRENFKQLLDSNLFSEDRIMDTLEQFEIKNLTSLNDMLAFDFENVLDVFGCDVDAWNENLVIQKA